MGKDNRNHHLLQLIILLVALLFVAVNLCIEDINIARGIIGTLFLYAMYQTIVNGWQWWCGNKSKIVLRERYLSFVASMMFLFLITGTALFMQVFYIESKIVPLEGDTSYSFTNTEYLLRSLACSFQLFTGSIDSTVVDGIKNHKLLKGLISIQSLLSFSCTIAVLLSLAYARIIAYYKLYRRTSIDEEHNHLYVFFGLNEPSRLLANSIREKEGSRAIILFVENRAQTDDSQYGLSNIVGMFTHRRQTFKDVDELGARVTFTEIKLCDIRGEKVNKTDILGEINLIKLRSLISSLGDNIDDAQMHIFFLSDNEDENIRSLAVLALDETIQHTKEHIKQRFYCHARQNGLHRIVEDIAVEKGIDTRIIDSSQLAVELLKANSDNHPIHLVELDKKNPTTVKSAFNSLIIGFDEVGRDALKFLYEFGAFVDNNSVPQEERRSQFHCIVIDRRMDELKGSFVNFAPAVMQQRNNDKKQTPLVELKTCDFQKVDFYDNILCEDFCKNVNYIVIAVGDDELGMTSALRIFSHIRRVRKDLSKLRIYVRSYSYEKEVYMQNIAQYYNDSYIRGLINENSISAEPVIRLFGQMKEIYTYETIVNEELTRKGKIYQAGYARLKGETTTWDSRRKKCEENGSLDCIRKLRRQEIQDLGNALHADTKIYLLKDAMGKDFDGKDFLRRYFNDNEMPQREGSYNKITYPFLTKYENEVILNLARLEHIRWNASHEMLGYTKAHDGLHECNERTREHNCLRPWHELDEQGKIITLKEGWFCDYKAYDFCVVDNSILLNKEKIIAQQ